MGVRTLSQVMAEKGSTEHYEIVAIGRDHPYYRLGDRYAVVERRNGYPRYVRTLADAQRFAAKLEDGYGRDRSMPTAGTW